MWKFLYGSKKFEVEGSSYFCMMDPLRNFLMILHERYGGPFLVDGIINSNDNVIRELHRVDHLYSIKFSLQVESPNEVVGLIQDWAPRAFAEVKHVYWKDLDSIVTLHVGMRYMEVATQSIQFSNLCGDYANQMDYRIRRGPP